MGELEKKVIIKLDGGIGNQLFQWAHGFKLSKLNKASLYYDASLSKKNQSNDFKRPLLLNKLGISIEAESSEIQLNSVTSKIASKIGFSNYRSLKEIPLSYIPESIGVFKEKTIVTEGYWQSYRYFEDIADLIRESINLPSAELNVNTIGIHVRRGDYISNLENSKIYVNLAKTEYYNNAIKFIKTEVDNPVFEIYSDDIDWCKKMLNVKDASFIQNSNVLEDFYGLAKMRSPNYCK